MVARNDSFLENKTQEILRVSSHRIFPSEAITGIGIFPEMSQVNCCSDGCTARVEGKL